MVRLARVPGPAARGFEAGRAAVGGRPFELRAGAHRARVEAAARRLRDPDHAGGGRRLGGRGGQGRRGHRVPGGAEGVVGRRRPQVRPRAWCVSGCARPPRSGGRSPSWRRARCSSPRWCPLADATECVVGVSHDELFGPVVLFGLGGVFVEVLQRRHVPGAAVRRRRGSAHDRRGRRRGPAARARGRPVGDEAALVDALVRVGRLALEQASVLAELDINPLVVRPKGQGVVALDAWRSSLDDAAGRYRRGRPDRVRQGARRRRVGAGAAGHRAGARRRRRWLRRHVDGLFSYTLETTDEVDIARNLGCADVTAFAQVGYGGGAGCGVVGLAAMAVAAGQCEVAVAWRSRKRGRRPAGRGPTWPPRLSGLQAVDPAVRAAAAGRRDRRARPPVPARVRLLAVGSGRGGAGRAGLRCGTRRR